MSSFFFLTFFVGTLTEELTITSAIQGFVDFKNAFSRKYTSAAEEAQRFICFVENSKIIKTLNLQEHGATFAMNKFSDMCADEFKATMLNLNLAETNLTKISEFVKKVETPKKIYEDESFDWRLRGGVVPVKNQGNCSSGWAFSIVCAMEGSWFAAGKTLTAFSEELLLDCNPYLAGCEGGNPQLAIIWIIRSGGITTEADYPYVAGNIGRPSVCNRTKLNFHKVGVFSYLVQAGYNEYAFSAYLQKYGPLIVGVDSSSWQFYQQGVHTQCNGRLLNHFVNIVGYGWDRQRLNVQYWIIRNSWGNTWGEDGYIRVQRGINCDMLSTFALGVSV